MVQLKFTEKIKIGFAKGYQALRAAGVSERPGVDQQIAHAG